MILLRGLIIIMCIISRLLIYLFFCYNFFRVILLKKYFKYIIIFILFLSCLVYFNTLFRGDSYVNYGFSYNIVKGNLLYKDFNIILPVLSPLFYSIPLIIYNSYGSLLVFQSLILTFMFYLFDKEIGKKSIILLLLCVIGYPICFASIIFPSYNYLLMLLLFILFYFIKSKRNDYLIGIILGLMFCTKQTIGILIFIPSFYYLFKNRGVFIRRLIGYLIPILLMVFYLILTGSLERFIDLCILGLFSFTGNTYFDIYYLILFIIGILIIIYRIIKDKSNVYNYYVLIFGFICYPLFDYYHVSMFLFVVLYLIIRDINIKDKFINISYLFIVLFLCFNCFLNYSFGFNSINCFNHFDLLVERSSYVKNIRKVNKYLSDKKVIYLLRGSENYYFKIINDLDIDYYDLTNYGNYGYTGYDDYIEKLDFYHDYYFVIDDDLINSKNKNQQYITDFSDYVIKNLKKDREFSNYIIYYKE